MALDAATLALVARELKQELGDARIDKIYQPTRDEVILSLRSRTAAHRLLLCARTGSARVCLTRESYENPQTPPSFCMLLRKYLAGGRLVDVRTLPGDRIVYFDFLCTNEMGDLVCYTLAAELMGRYCNIVLVQNGWGENAGFMADLHAADVQKASQLAAARKDKDAPYPKIMDALKRVDFEDSELRQLLPGLPYTLPPQPAGRLEVLRAPFAQLDALLKTSDSPAPAVLRKAAGDVGPVVVREICHRAFAAQPREGEAGTEALATDATAMPARQLEAAQLHALEKALAAVRADYENGGAPCLVLGPDGLPVEFSFTALTQYLPGCSLVEYTGFSTMLEGYYAQKDKGERLRQKSKALRKTVQNLYDRAVRKQAARQEDLASSEKSDHLRVMGELLNANLFAFQKGDATVRLLNWYDGQEIDVKLDSRLGPAQNAQKYFKEYKKKQTAAHMLAELLQAGEVEIKYLETVLYEVDAAEGEAALGEIRAELKAQGYLKYYKQRDKRQKPVGFIRYQSPEGFVILVGRNNEQNEKLTLKTARGKDLWFHVKNAPGSHVVVMSEGKDIPLATQNQAAMLAVVHSSQKNGGKIPVDYTEVKNIRKTGDLPPGMVLYEHYETAYITPDEELLAKLEGGV